MTYIDTPQSLVIEGVEETTIVSYFATINQEEFDKTAALFAADGELHAPFEKPIVGRNAIASYLAQEAKGMELIPKQGVFRVLEENIEQIQVTGKVKTSLFSVNVSWYFNLNQERKIAKARIKLLASPKELLGLKQIKDDI